MELRDNGQVERFGVARGGIHFFGMSIDSTTRMRIKNSASVPTEQCIFCKIVARKLPAYIVLEDACYIAFLDASPFNIGHTLVCPKRHGETLWDMTENEIGGLFMFVSHVSKAAVRATGMDGFRIVQNNGEAANQVVAHVHVHVIPVSLQDKGRWMDRKKFTPSEMESIAEKIRRSVDEKAPKN